MAANASPSEENRFLYVNQLESKDNQNSEGASAKQGTAKVCPRKRCDSTSHHYEDVDVELWTSTEQQEKSVISFVTTEDLKDVYSRLEKVEENQQQIRQTTNGMVTEIEHLKTMNQSLHQLLKKCLDRFNEDQSFIVETSNILGEQIPHLGTMANSGNSTSQTSETALTMDTTETSEKT